MTQLRLATAVLFFMPLFVRASDDAPGAPNQQLNKAMAECRQFDDEAFASCTRKMQGPLDPVPDDPEVVAEVQRLRIAESIHTRCRRFPTHDLQATCNEHQTALQPERFRDYLKTRLFMEDLDLDVRRDAVRLSKAKAACRRMGIRESSVRIGMSAQQVRDCGWGDPNSVNRTIRAGHISEQWVYESGYLYFDNGILRTIED